MNSNILAVVNNETTSGNLNFIVIGLVIIVIILVVIALKSNK